MLIKTLEGHLTVKFPKLTYFNVSLGEYFINKINFIKKFNDFGAIFIL